METQGFPGRGRHGARARDLKLTRARNQTEVTAMSTPRSDSMVNELADRAKPLTRLASSEAVVKTREGLSRLVNKYPASTVLGAFAIGFAVARLIRALSED